MKYEIRYSCFNLDGSYVANDVNDRDDFISSIINTDYFQHIRVAPILPNGLYGDFIRVEKEVLK